MKITKDSTIRALRTLYQGVIGLAVAAPVLLTVVPKDTPSYQVAAGMVAVVAVVSKVLNALAAAGIDLHPAALTGVANPAEPATVLPPLVTTAAAATPPASVDPAP